MNKLSRTEQRIADIQERMRKAMPEIRRQIELYEKNLVSGVMVKTGKVAAQSRNV